MARSHSCDSQVQARERARSSSPLPSKRWDCVLGKSPKSYPSDQPEFLKHTVQTKQRNGLPPSPQSTDNITAPSASDHSLKIPCDQSSSLATKFNPNLQGDRKPEDVAVEGGRTFEPVLRTSEQDSGGSVLTSIEDGTLKRGPSSVLDLFNELVRGCDALERYNSDPTSCLATNKGNGKRCKRPIYDKGTRSRSEQIIRRSLENMAKMQIAHTERVSAQSLLKGLVDQAICAAKHRKEYYAEIDLLPISSNFISEDIKAKQIFSKSERFTTSALEPSSVTSTDIHGSLFCTEKLDHNQNLISSSSTALEKFDFVFPSAQKWFKAMPSQCLWQKTQQTPKRRAPKLDRQKPSNERCRNRIAAKNQSFIQDLFAILATLTIEWDVLESAHQLGKLADVAFCGQRHRQEARIALGQSLIDDLIHQEGPSIVSEALQQNGKDPPNKLVNEILKILASQKDVPAEDASIPGFEGFAEDCFTTDSKSFKRRAPKVQNRHLPVFESYKPVQSSEFTPSDYVLSKTLPVLKKTELPDGHLYVYWNRASFGVRKIGFTTNTIMTRLRQWTNQCNHVVEELPRPTVRIPHVKRFEKIIHADLNEYRVRDKCQGCNAVHREWFKDIPDSVLNATIDKWTDWMLTSPYEDTKQGWQLTKIARETLFEVCTKAITSEIEIKGQDLKTKEERRLKVKKTRTLKKTSNLPSGMRWVSQHNLRSQDHHAIPTKSPEGTPEVSSDG